MKLPHFIKRIAKFCDADEIRHSLNGIHCKSDGRTAQVTATSGRVLVSVHWPDEDGEEVNAIAEGKSLSAPPAPAFKHPNGVRFDGTQFRGGHEGAVEVIDGRFPECEQFFPESLDGYAAVRLDAALFRKLCDLANDMNKKGRDFTLFVKDADSPVFATAASGEGHVARMCVMPRVCDSKDWKPEFPGRVGI
jgi:DNA polymerase III sliding clamp (beta) subunit (PCNA family)